MNKKIYFGVDEPTSLLGGLWGPGARLGASFVKTKQLLKVCCSKQPKSSSSSFFLFALQSSELRAKLDKSILEDASSRVKNHDIPKSVRYYSQAFYISTKILGINCDVNCNPRHLWVSFNYCNCPNYRNKRLFLTTLSLLHKYAFFLAL